MYTDVYGKEGDVKAMALCQISGCQYHYYEFRNGEWHYKETY